MSENNKTSRKSKYNNNKYSYTVNVLGTSWAGKALPLLYLLLNFKSKMYNLTW